MVSCLLPNLCMYIDGLLSGEVDIKDVWVLFIYLWGREWADEGDETRGEERR